MTLYHYSFVLKSRNIPTIFDLFNNGYLDFEYQDLLETHVQMLTFKSQLKRGNAGRKIPEINQKVLVSIVRMPKTQSREPIHAKTIPVFSRFS